MFLRTTATLLMCVLLLQSHAQSFQKVLRKANNESHYMRKLLRVNDAEFACLTSTEFYRINQQGDILFQKTIGISGYDLQELNRMPGGQFLLAGGLYSGADPVIKLTGMNANGKILREKKFTIHGSFDNLRIIPSGQNHFFLVYVHLEDNRRHVDIIYMDEAFNVIRHQHEGWVAYNTLYAIAGENDGLEFLINDPDNQELHHLKIDINGNLSEQPVEYKGPEHAITILRKAIKTPDGGYLYSGVEIGSFKNDNLLMVKTDHRGIVEWVKKYDFFFGDIDDDIALIDDGYMVLAWTGYNPNDFNMNTTDITLLKLDLAGELVWSKSYGTSTMDYSRSLLVNKDGTFTIGGQATTYYMTLTEPVIFKTDAQGYFPEYSFPHPLVDPSPVVITNAAAISPIQRMTGGALLADGGMIMSASIIDPEVDWLYPFISRSDAQGNIIWHHPAPEGYESILMKPMADGNFLSVSKWEEDFYITKLNADGKIDWTTNIKANFIKDAVMAPDGGYLLCGMEHEGLGATTRNMLVVKLSKQGQELWRYHHSINRKWIYARSILITPEKDIVVAGFMQESQNPQSATYLAKISETGTLKWYKTFPHGTNIAAGNKVIITSSKDYLITGYVRYPAELHKQDLLLLKTDAQGNLIWEKEFNIDKMDAGTSIIEYAGQYYIAGTTGQPEFGARESFGLMFRTDTNGLQKGFKSFGNKGTMLACTDLYADAQNKLHFMGTVQQPFPIERPFQAVFEPDLVLSTIDPALEKGISIYPVPAKQQAFLLIDHKYTGDIRITITGISGVQLHSFKTQKTQPNLRVSLPVSMLASGTYVVEVLIGQSKFVKKLIIGK